MIIFLTVFIVFSMSFITFNNNLNYTSLEQRFYTCVKSVCENSVTFNFQTNDTYFDKSSLKNNIISTLNRNLKGIIHKYDLYINYYYSDFTPCSYACKSVDIRVKAKLLWNKEFNKGYYLTLTKGNIYDG